MLKFMLTISDSSDIRMIDNYLRSIRSKLNTSLSWLDVIIDNYLSSLQSRINSTSSYLDVILIDVISKIKANKDLNKTTAKALLDTGSLAGDFISNDFIVDLNLVNYVEIDNNEIQICSGLDNNCSSTSGSITLSLSFKNEVNNKTEFVTLVFKILHKSPIDIIIGRKSIKALKMVAKTPSHFYDTNSLCCHTCTTTKVNTLSVDNPSSVHMCGCQRLSDLLPIEPSVSPTEIQVTEITNRLVRCNAEPSVVERNMLSSKLAPLVALWGDNPPSEPRVGGVLLGDNPPQSLTAVSQTHTVVLKFGDVQSYRMNDVLIYDKLYSPFRETDQQSLQEVFPNNHSYQKNLDNDTILNALTSDTLNTNTRYIEDDGID